MNDSFHIFKLMFKTLKMVQSKFTAIFLHRVRVSRQNRRLIFKIATSGKFLSQVFVMQHQSAWHSKYLTGPRSQGSGVTSHSRLSFVVMLFLSPRFNHFSLVMFNIRGHVVRRQRENSFLFSSELGTPSALLKPSVVVLPYRGSLKYLCLSHLPPFFR